MIGHNQIIAMRMAGNKPKSVFVQFGKTFNAEKDVSDGIIPTVWIDEKDHQKLVDLSWAKDLNIQLMPGKDIVQFTKWWVALVDAEVNTIIGLDNDGEINVYRKG
jgi:hypothetical protein